MTRTLTIDVHYPTDEPLELHVDDDWPVARTADHVDGTRRCFLLETERPSIAFKPVLLRSGEALWAQGDNCRVAVGQDRVEVYPFFGADPPSIDPEHPLDDEVRGYRFQTFLPPGYHENPLRTYPLVLLHDGGQVLLPDLAGDREAGVVEILVALARLEVGDSAVFVGVYPEDRETWTRPGYATYADHVVQELLPKLEDRYRIRSGPEQTVALGSGQAGVAAFYLAWEWPGVVGRAGCLSGTFGVRDNLLERVATESRRELRLSLDGVRPDGLEPTLTLVETLRARGYGPDEARWSTFADGVSPATRVDLALQSLFA